MTWHQWHQTAERDSRIGRPSLRASANAGSPHVRQSISCARLGRGEKRKSVSPSMRWTFPRGIRPNRVRMLLAWMRSPYIEAKGTYREVGRQIGEAERARAEELLAAGLEAGGE